MKKIAALLLVLTVLLENAALAEVQIIESTGAAGAGGDLTYGEKLEVEKLGDFTPLSTVADTYAFSIAAFERDETEEFTTSNAGDWASRVRYKFDFKGDTHPWSEMYLAYDYAVQASSDEYKLVDVRMSILNRMITAMDLGELIQAKLTYAGEYEFELQQVRMETADNIGNANEWLVPATPIPMLVERNVHFLFEVPNIVATSTEDLSVTFTINGQDYELVIR